MHVVFIASTPYHHLHHRSQRLANAFRAWGIPVTYVEQTYGWRAYLKGGRPGLLRNIGRAAFYHARTAGGIRSGKRGKADQDFRVVEMPLVMPTTRIDSAKVERSNAHIFRNVLEREVFPALQGKETVALIDNPMWGLVVRRGDFGKIFYDCIDDISLYSGRSSLERFRSYERQLVENVDGVFVTARRLEEHIRSLNAARRVVRIPNGVDPEWFEQRAAEPAPEDTVSMKRPVVGYIGNIADWLAYDTVLKTAQALPDVTFLLVGPVDFASRLERLRAPNIVWLGRKPYADVPRYIEACDVCWIPFERGPLVDNTNPIKLYEYFALGKPVVTSHLVEAEEYAKKGFVYMGESADDMISSVQAALREQGTGLREGRREIARQHAWTTLAQRMRTEMEQGTA